MEPNALSSNTAGLAQVAHAISAPALFFFLPFLRRLRKVSHCQNSRDMQMTVILLSSHRRSVLVNSITIALDNLARKTLIICGYSAEVGVLLTALGGLRQGYNVFIPVDCVGSQSLRTETVVLKQAEKAGAVITSLATLAAQLAPDFSREPGKTILSVISNAKC